VREKQTKSEGECEGKLADHVLKEEEVLLVRRTRGRAPGAVRIERVEGQLVVRWAAYHQAIEPGATAGLEIENNSSIRRDGDGRLNIDLAAIERTDYDGFAGALSQELQRDRRRFGDGQSDRRDDAVVAYAALGLALP
jgi:hypothetical protein